MAATGSAAMKAAVNTAAAKERDRPRAEAEELLWSTGTKGGKFTSERQKDLQHVVIFNSFCEMKYSGETLLGTAQASKMMVLFHRQCLLLLHPDNSPVGKLYKCLRAMEELPTSFFYKYGDKDRDCLGMDVLLRTKKETGAWTGATLLLKAKDIEKELRKRLADWQSMLVGNGILPSGWSLEDMYVHLLQLLYNRVEAAAATKSAAALTVGGKAAKAKVASAAGAAAAPEDSSKRSATQLLSGETNDGGDIGSTPSPGARKPKRTPGHEPGLLPTLTGWKPPSNLDVLVFLLTGPYCESLGLCINPFFLMDASSQAGAAGQALTGPPGAALSRKRLKAETATKADTARLNRHLMQEDSAASKMYNIAMRDSETVALSVMVKKDSLDRQVFIDSIDYAENDEAKQEAIREFAAWRSHRAAAQRASAAAVVAAAGPSSDSASEIPLVLVAASDHSSSASRMQILESVESLPQSVSPSPLVPATGSDDE